ncbi:MAG: nitrite/sulfite reductase [Chloroflexi bacterium]|nr:nitrite/sulfite reductase [Chloroflexota bacterium]
MTTTTGTEIYSEAKDRPGWVIPILEEEFDDFETEATAFLNGEREEKQFIGFRLKQGVYGQRQADRQMMRVKLPFGGVTPDQLDAFGQVAERYAPLRKGHITTRQNFQFHHMLLKETPAILRLLGDSGLSTREACGNTVRNVTGDPWAGVRSDEPFDISPYAGAFARYWVRHELTQLLPRKFKVSFSGSDEDAAMGDIHDLGFIARTKMIDGEAVRGFKMVTGGGLSIMAKRALLLREFVSVDDYLRVSEAVLRIFNRTDWLRKNIAKARIKFLVQKVGEEAFQKMVDEELEGEWAQQHYPLDELIFDHDEEAVAAKPAADPAQPSDDDRTVFEHWVEVNVRAQRQQGYSAVEVKVPQGDLTPEHFRGLASILRTLGSGLARTTAWQNIVLRWIPDENLYAVWKALGELGLGEAGAMEVSDIVSCPGTDSCKLGITSSMGLNRAIQAKIEEMKVTDPLTRRVLINISGCPNSCGQHHIGNIGFHGAAQKSGERQVPAYKVFVGGQRRPGQRLEMGQILKTTIAAKRVPIVVERFLTLYEDQRDDGEEFNAFVERVGPETFTAAIDDLKVAPEFSMEAMQEFIDWERDGLYVLERGEGECAV